MQTPMGTPDRLTSARLTPRRLASIRRLSISGIAILALLVISDIVLNRDTGLALLRVAVIGMLFGLWWLSRNLHTSARMARNIYLQLLLVSSGSSLGLFFDQAHTMELLNTMMLVIVVSGSAWSSLRYFTTGMLVSLFPMVVVLAVTRVDADVWYHYAMFLAASVLVAYSLWRQRMLAAAASAGLRAELVRSATEDAMTGILNRSGWNQRAPTALASADAADRPLALLYFDLDNFKSINDHYGHAAGDAVIEQAAQLIRNEVREHDLVARLGGEEFAVLLTGAGASLALAAAVAERIRRNLENSIGPTPCTLSVGVAERLPGESLDTLIGRADAALLRAKRNGRNCVEQAVAAEPAALNPACDPG